MTIPIHWECIYALVFISKYLVFATVLSDRSAYLLRFTILVHSYYLSQSTLFVSTILVSMNPPTSLETQMSVMINACIIALLASDIT